MNKNRSFWSSFGNAFKGMLMVWKEERNLQMESVIGVMALILCFVCKVKTYEWLAVLFCCMIVLSLECMNSALENAVDYTGEEIHVLAKRAKDFAAGSVLIASIFSGIIGVVIFLPYVIQFTKVIYQSVLGIIGSRC